MFLPCTIISRMMPHMLSGQRKTGQNAVLSRMWHFSSTSSSGSQGLVRVSGINLLYLVLNLVCHLKLPLATQSTDTNMPKVTHSCPKVTNSIWRIKSGNICDAVSTDPL